MTFGPEKVAHVGGVQERFNEFRHGGLMAELGGIAFYGSETQVIHDTMGQCGLTYTGRAIEKGCHRCPGSLHGSPRYECIVVGLVEKW